MKDLIDRQAAIDALMPIYKSASLRNRNVFSTARKCMVTIEELQSARPDNQINLCDSCDYSYPDCPSKNGDVIFGNNIGNDNICACNKYKPSAQPERTCVNCGRTANNGGWYADGGTRCPIEEHYALPKDGYCHLWEKRNVTDDDYPERREDERPES